MFKVVSEEVNRIHQLYRILSHSLLLGDALVWKAYRLIYTQPDNGYAYYALYHGQRRLGAVHVRAEWRLPAIRTALAQHLAQIGFDDGAQVCEGGACEVDVPCWGAKRLVDIYGESRRKRRARMLYGENTN